MSSQARPAWRSSLRSVLPAWLASRAVVLVGLALAKLAVAGGGIGGTAAELQSRAGLMAWDAGWYAAIAEHGYGGVAEEALRFFPLWPGLGQLGHLVGVPVAWTLGIGASLAFLAGLVVFDQLGAAVGMVGRERAVSIWLMSLAPGAVATVLGYAEGFLVLLASACLCLLYRSPPRLEAARWASIAGLGFLAGLTRPVGLLLAVPIGIEAWRQRSGARLLPLQALAAASPLLGTAAYLLWVGSAFGDPLLPLRIQTEAGRHGALGDPISGLVHAVSLAASGHLSALVHLAWVAAAVVAIWVGRRAVPLSATSLSVAVVLLALCGSNLDSFERYLLASPPLFLAAAAALRSKRISITVCMVLGALLLATATLAFLGRSVP